MLKTEKHDLKLFIESWIIIYLGGMTQYYILVVAFWGVLLYCIIMLKEHNIKGALIYGTGALVVVGLIYLSYPFIITQATGSETNNIGKEVVKDFFNIPLWIKQTIHLAGSLASRLGAKRVIGLIITVVIAGFFFAFAAKPGIAVLFDMKWATWLIGVMVLTFLSIAFIGGIYVYLRYIYNIVPIVYVLIFYTVDLFSYKTRFCTAIAIVCILFSIGNYSVDAFGKTSAYLYIQQRENIKSLNQYFDNKLVVIPKKEERTSVVPTNSLPVFSKFKHVFLSSERTVAELEILDKVLLEEASCVVYFGTNSTWLDGINPGNSIKVLLKEKTDVSFLKLCDDDFGSYYLLKNS